MSKFPADLFDDGTSPGGDAFRYRGLVPYAMNEFLAYFDVDGLDGMLEADDVLGFTSVTNPRNWSVVAVDPGIQSVQDPTRFFVPPGCARPTYTPEIGQAFLDPDDLPASQVQVHIKFNIPAEERVIYQITVSDQVRGTDCQVLEGDDTQEAKGLIRGVGPLPRFVTDDIYRDFDLQYFPVDPQQPNATWRYDSTSDIGIQPGLESLRKRILRRLSTLPTGFKHLGRLYGADLGIKTLARSGKLQKLANIAAEQTREEPDVSDAGAECRLTFAADGTAIIELHIRAVLQTREEARLTFTFNA